MMTTMRSIVGVATVMLVGALQSQAQQRYTATVVAEDKQELKGWGIFPAFNQPSWTTPYDNADEVPLDYIYGELGADIYRHEFSHDCYNGSGLDRGYIDRSVGRALKEQYEREGSKKWIASSWSPPTAFKDCNTCKGLCGDGSVNSLRRDKEDDYCRYVVDLIKYLMDTYGTEPPLAYSLQNELGWANDQWCGTRYDREQWVRVVKLMRRTLDENGLSAVKIHGPESSGFNKPNSGVSYYVGGEDLTSFANDAELVKALNGGLAAHAYSESDGANAAVMRNMVRNARERYGMDAWLTEIERGGESEIEGAVNNVRGMLRDVVYCEFNYWLHWQGYYERSTVAPKVTVIDKRRTKLFYAYQSIWTRAHEGYRVRELRSDDPELEEYATDHVEMGAFVGDKSMVIVIANHRGGRNLEIGGLSGTSAKAYHTSESGNNALVDTEEIVNGKATFSIPALSVVVIETNQGMATGHDPSGRHGSRLGRAHRGSARLYLHDARGKRVGSAAGMRAAGHGGRLSPGCYFGIPSLRPDVKALPVINEP